jgi:hypothetical protein
MEEPVGHHRRQRPGPGRIGIRRGRLLHNEADVTINEPSVKDKDLLLLLTLGWYMILLILQDSAAAAAGA